MAKSGLFQIFMAIYLSVYTKKGITDDRINGTAPNLEENRPFLSLLSQESKMKPLYEKTIVQENFGTFLRDESTTNLGIAQETNYWIARTGNTTTGSNFPNKSTPDHHFPAGNQSVGFPKNGDEMTEDLDAKCLKGTPINPRRSMMNIHSCLVV